MTVEERTIRIEIGPHTVERELGRGGMGRVYLCRDPALERHQLQFSTTLMRASVGSLLRHHGVEPELRSE